MSLESDRKAQHARQADEAITKGNLRKAAFHLAKAGEYALKLADKSEGKVGLNFVREAEDLIDLAEAFSQKAAAEKPAAPAAATPKLKHKESKDEKDEEGGDDWLVTEKPKVRLSDIAGMDDVKAKLQEMVIKPLKHPEQAKQWGIRPGGGILLYGPPGNGKTTLGKAVAGELEADFFYATGAEIRSKWHGESEQRLRKLIQAAKSRPVAVLFLDDVDGLLPRRGGNSTVDNRIVVQFLNEIGGFEESPNTLLVLGATNKPEDLDEGVFRTGRFDEKIFVGLPDQPAREFMVKKNLGDAPVDPGLDPAAVAAKLESYTGSDIVAVVQSAKRAGFRRSIDGGSNVLTVADIDLAMKTIPSSATPDLMREYERFAKARFK
jgi:transitional endoplasmic reticulum ATPase